MAKLEFTPNASPTIGVELELGIVHGETFQLESGCSRMIERLPVEVANEVKHELMQCCVEVISGVCHTVGDARGDLSAKLRQVEQAADAEGLKLW